MSNSNLSTFALSGLIASIAAGCGGNASSAMAKEVFVPGGPLIVGADCREGRVEPACDRSLYDFRFNASLNSFYADRNLVARSEYDECVQAKACPDDLKASPRYLENLARTTYRSAQAYCRWRGKNLPTANEFERIARGTDGRVTPWGSGASPCDEPRLGLECFDQAGPAGARSVAFVPQWVDPLDDRRYPDGMIRGANRFTFQAFAPEDFNESAFFRCVRLAIDER